MTDLKTTSYDGPDIARGEAFLISNGDQYQTYPRYIAVAAANISAEKIDKAKRIADLNEIELADLLLRRGDVTLYPVNNLVCKAGTPFVQMQEAGTEPKVATAPQDDDLNRFLDAYAATKATSGEDAEDPIEERLARLDHLYQVLRGEIIC